jgi:hypothetical protein
MQTPVAPTCGTPPALPPHRWKMVKQWPFDMLGASSLSSAVAYDSNDRKYMVDLVPLFRGLTDLANDLSTKSGFSFWDEFHMHIDLPDINQPSHRHVKKALDAHWRKLTGKYFPKAIDEEVVCIDDDSQKIDLNDQSGVRYTFLVHPPLMHSCFTHR